jgi:sulfur carrier protein
MEAWPPACISGANSLRIEVNGEVRQTTATTVLGLVQELSLDPKKVAVELNLEIVPRSLHGETALAEGDKIELVQFVGGG